MHTLHSESILNDFSLLQSLLGGSSKIEEKTSRMKQARDKNITRNKNNPKAPSRKVDESDSSFIRIPQYGHRINNNIVNELENSQRGEGGFGSTDC